MQDHAQQVGNPKVTGARTKRGNIPYPNLTQPCTDWFHASGSLALRDKIFTDNLYQPFHRLADFHFKNTNHPAYLDRDSDLIIAEVLSHLYEALLSFRPQQGVTGNAWYYFNLCARNATWRILELARREVVGARKPGSGSLNIYVGDLGDWDGYLPPAEPDAGFDPTPLFEACEDFDPELVAALTELDSDEFTNMNLKLETKIALSQSLPNFNKRVKAMKARFK